MKQEELESWFAKAKKTAEDILKNKAATDSLASEVEHKAKDKQHLLKQSFDDFMTLMRLVKAWTKGSYRSVPTGTIVSAVAALVYFLNPMDLVPDFLLAVGFLDDITILTFVLQRLHQDLVAFKAWEKKNSEERKNA